MKLLFWRRSGVASLDAEATLGFERVLLKWVEHVDEPHRYAWLRTEIETTGEKEGLLRVRHLLEIHHELERTLVVAGRATRPYHDQLRPELLALANRVQLPTIAMLADHREKRVDILIHEVRERLFTAAREVLGARVHRVAEGGSDAEAARKILELAFSVAGAEVAQRLAQNVYRSLNSALPLSHYPEILRLFPQGMLKDVERRILTREELEKEVRDRNQKLEEARNFSRNLLDSLSEGILVFDREGACLPNFSHACLDLFGGSPQGKTIWDVLRVAADSVPVFRQWYESLFAQKLPFADLIEWGPKSLPYDSGRQIMLHYYPMRKADGALGGVIVVATDKTQEYEASLTAERERGYASTVVKIARNKYQFLIFVGEARIILSGLRTELEAARTATRAADLELCARLMHTLKGGAALFNLRQVCDLAHEYEDRLSVLKGVSQPQQTEAVSGLEESLYLVESALERFILMAREIVGSAVDDGQRRIELRVSELDEFAVKLDSEARSISKEFRHRFLAEPVAHFLSHFEEFLLNAAKAQGKRVKPLIFEGKEHRIIGERYSELFGCLVHAFRNIVDHGIETPHEREQAGKDPAATVRVSFTPEPASWRLVIADDGRGIDPRVIRDKLKARGRVSLAETETDQEILQHVLNGGLSTRSKVDQFSGRGVGMDAIKHACEHLGGRAELHSELGKGTQLTCVFPDRS